MRAQSILLVATVIVLLIVGFAIGVKDIEAQKITRPYSVFRIERSGQDRCIYVFGTQFGVTSVIDYLVSEGSSERCAVLSQE